MTAPAKFLFDTDFAAPAVAPQPDDAPYAEPKIDPDLHRKQVEAARKTGFKEGEAAGRASAEAQAADQLAKEAERIATAVSNLMDALDADRANFEQKAADLALQAASKLAGDLIEAEPTAQIEAVLAECLSPLRRAPHLVIRLNEADADGLKPQAEQLAAERGFEGRLVILGEPEIPRGDCRIEWADGGLVLDREQTRKKIDQAVAAYFENRNAGKSDEASR